MSHPDSPDLDADLVAAFCAAQADAPLDAAAAQRVKRRVLQRIAELEDGHVTVQASDDGWQRFSRGVQIKVLHEAAGTMSYLLKLAPGAVLPAHRHPQDEECVVLEGAVKIGDELTVSAGGFHLAHRGALHAELSSPGGAVLFLRGAVPDTSALI
jgi:quercetin dioxygenase-like cupin family protein